MFCSSWFLYLFVFGGTEADIGLGDVNFFLFVVFGRMVHDQVAEEILIVLFVLSRGLLFEEEQPGLTHLVFFGWMLVFVGVVAFGHDGKLFLDFIDLGEIDKGEIFLLGDALELDAFAAGDGDNGGEFLFDDGELNRCYRFPIPYLFHHYFY